MSRMRLQNTYVRISPRGFVESTNAIHSLPFHWNYALCAPISNALCQEMSSHKQLWFPDFAADVPDNWHKIPQTALTTLVNTSQACVSEITNRVINIQDDRYEISLCDLLDANLDVIYTRDLDSHDTILLWKQDNTSFYEFLLLALVAIYLISCVSQNIADMFTAAHDIISRKDNKSKIAMLASTDVTYQIQNAFVLSILIYSLICFFLIDRDVLVTVADVTLFIHTCAYCSLTLVFHFLGLPKVFYVTSDDNGALLQMEGGIPGHNISLLTACLLLMSVKVHHTFDNPYLTFLVVLFGWRTFVKVFMCKQIYKDQVFSALLDLILFFSLLSNGLCQTFHNPIEGKILSLTIICISAIVAVVTSSLFDLITLYLATPT